MDFSLLFVMVGVLSCLYIWIGQRASNNLQTNEDYFLMGRKLTFFPLCFTLLATQLGGGTLLGAAEEAYTRGWIILLYPLGASLGLIVLGMGFGAKLRKLNISTIAEVFEKIYGSWLLRRMASILSIVSFYFILVGQGIAARNFFLSMEISEIYFILFWVVLVSYTVMGGFKAVVDTDVLQAVLILVVLLIAWCFIDLSVLLETFSVSSIFGSSAGVSEVSGVGEVAENVASFDVPWVSWLLLPFLFMLIEQDMGQRCFAAKTPKVIGPAAISSGIILFAGSFIAVAFGVLAKELKLEPAEGSSVLINAVKILTNPQVTTLFMGAILMAISSTADSLLCAISTNLSFDFFSSKKISEKKRINLSRFLTLITGISALGVGYLFNNVVSVLMLSYELSICVLFVPVVGAVLLDKPSILGAYCSMICGAIGFILFRVAFVDFLLPKEVLTLILSFLGFVLGSKESFGFGRDRGVVQSAQS